MRIQKILMMLKLCMVKMKISQSSLLPISIKLMIFFEVNSVSSIFIISYIRGSNFKSSQKEKLA